MLVVVSTVGLLGVYKIEKDLDFKRLVHIASSIVPEDITVKTAFFSEDNEVLTVFTSDGMRHDYSVLERKNGLMKELMSKGTDLAA